MEILILLFCDDVNVVYDGAIDSYTKNHTVDV